VECLQAAGRDRGIMRVTFLYAIESTGGRGEKLRSPMDIFFDRKAQELYVADAGHSAIFIYDANGMFIEKIAVNSEEGSPTMIALDEAGLMYVGHNRSARISVFNFQGRPLDVLDLPGVIDVPGSAIRPLYLAANTRDGGVYALKSSGGLVKLDPDGENHEEISITGQNPEDMPNVIYGMSIDQEGRFLFADMRPYSIVRFDREQGSFFRFGSPGVIYGQISRPAGTAIDDAGHIFATSTVRNKVLAYDREGGFIEEFGGIGKDYGRFYMPSKIVSDGGNRLFVLETPLKRVQVFAIEFPGERQTAERTSSPVPEAE
jgi:DNA-binding beta-propeller fold protein YncE